MLKLLALLLLVCYLGAVWYWERKRQRNNPWRATPTERRVRLRDKHKRAP